MIAKAKAVPLHTMKALGGRGGIAPTQFLFWHYMVVSGQCHALAVLWPWGEDRQVLINLIWIVN
jgi:hypothetical protein